MAIFFGVLNECFESLLQFFESILCDGYGCAFGHDELRHDVVGGDFREEDKGNSLAGNEREHDDEKATKEGDTGVAIAD